MSLLRRASRIVILILAAVALIVTVGLAYLFLALPSTAAPREINIERTAARVERGEYLSHHVAGCVHCHGARDWSKYAAPLIPGTEGRGGAEFPLGDAGTLRAPNITPAGIGDWTDGELLRAMTEGVSRDGSPLFPLMPYPNYRQMAQEDAEAIVAYIRTLPSVAREVPPSTLSFPLNLIVRTIPEPATLPQARPAPSDRVAYGRYLTTMASCTDCHTPMDDRGQFVEGMAFAGGNEFSPGSGGVIRSANITPDVETGIGSWTEQDFVERFKVIAEASDADLQLDGRQNTEMPWRDYGGMTRDDLGAIYAYLRTVPAVRNAVP